MPPDTGDFRLIDRRVLEVYRQFNEEPRFFRGLVSWVGFKQIGVPFVRRPRAAGTTKYRYGRLLRDVWVQRDGRLVLVGLELVRQGDALVTTFPQDVKYVDDLLAAQRQARDAGVGLWAGR